jgi:putative membrane protein
MANMLSYATKTILLPRTMYLLVCLWLLSFSDASTSNNNSFRSQNAHQATASIQTTSFQRSDSLESFLSDVSNIQGLKIDLVGASHSKRDSSYTKSWTNADWVDHQVNCWFRYRNHVTSWIKSPTAVALFPTVMTSIAWAGLMIVISSNISSVASFIKSASFSTGTLSALSSPIALLLALRTNRALDRLFEVRGQWGVVIRVLTSLASQANTYIKPKNNEACLLIGRYLAIYGWCIKGLFRGEDASLLVSTMLPSEEVQWLLNSPLDLPVSIVTRLRSLVATSDLSIPAHSIMETELTDLERALGICKRILGSPIPPTYTRHTSRVLFVFLAFLPLAMFAGGASPIAVLLNVAITTYIFVGIDEIGVEIEHPFPLLPMYHLTCTMQKNVVAQFIASESMPKTSYQ